jgi:glycosyltransferase involved in cell wall biosynthesis
LKILQLPYNVASIPYTTTTALNKIEGINAKCLIQAKNIYQSTDAQTIFLPKSVPKKNIFKWLFYKLCYKTQLKKLLKWADVLHYTWDSVLPNGDDLQWAKKYKKSIFIEWLGSDIRYPEKLFPINSFYKDVFNKGYEYSDIESKQHSLQTQLKFKSVNAEVLVTPEISLFVDRNIFEKPMILFQRINCFEFEINYPSIKNERPVIVHTPSARIAKGTDIIEKVIDQLKENYQFDFILIENISRAEAISLRNKADNFIDQLVIGGYGMAALEAMSQGKPVFSYIMPQVFNEGLPKECPIVNVNKDNLKEKLSEFITNPVLRHETGIKSRQFVEKYHDADTIAKELISIYKKALQKSK